jgi:hypothetical protein
VDGRKWHFQESGFHVTRLLSIFPNCQLRPSTETSAHSVHETPDLRRLQPTSTGEVGRIGKTAKPRLVDLGWPEVWTGDMVDSLDRAHG